MSSRWAFSKGAWVLLVFASFAYSQTTVTTTGGTTNSVPKFSGSSTVVNSAITDNAGKIGIGTATPAYTLDVVNGRGRFKGDGTFSSGFWLTNPADSGDTAFLGRTDTSATAPLGIWENNAFRLTVNTLGQVFWGNVSASTSPSVLNTDAGGSIELGGYGAMPNSVSGGVPYIDLHYGNGLAQDYNIRLSNGGDNLFQVLTASSGAVLNIKGANVGIGTTNPTQKLELNGGGLKIDTSGTGITFADGSTQTTATLQGPAGPQGPPGPTLHSSASCFFQPQQITSCGCSRTISQTIVAPPPSGNNSCTVTSDTGTCSANTSPNNNWIACCSCALQ